MMFFKVIYYFIGLIFVFIELGKLTKIKSYVRKIVEYKGWTKMRKKRGESTEWSETPEELKISMLYLTVYTLSEFLWLGLGIFTFNWGFILAFFGISHIIGKLTGQKNIYSDGLVRWSIFWSLITIMFYLFLIINSFHLHLTPMGLFN